MNRPPVQSKSLTSLPEHRLGFCWGAPVVFFLSPGWCLGSPLRVCLGSLLTGVFGALCFWIFPCFWWVPQIRGVAPLFQLGGTLKLWFCFRLLADQSSCGSRAVYLCRLINYDLGVYYLGFQRFAKHFHVIFKLGFSDTREGL